jgi:hypothetical protein
MHDCSEWISVQSNWISSPFAKYSERVGRRERCTWTTIRSCRRRRARCPRAASSARSVPPTHARPCSLRPCAPEPATFSQSPHQYQWCAWFTIFPTQPNPLKKNLNPTQPARKKSQPDPLRKISQPNQPNPFRKKSQPRLTHCQKYSICNSNFLHVHKFSMLV